MCLIEKDFEKMWIHLKKYIVLIAARCPVNLYQKQLNNKFKYWLNLNGCYTGTFVYFFCFLSILSDQTTMTEHLYFIVNAYVKSRENPEHQYWPVQSRPIRDQICIGRVVLSVSQRQFSFIYVNIIVIY